MDSRGVSESSWLSTLLAPLSVDEFLSEFWGKRHLHCRGSAGRFARLLSWDALNEILAHHWREPHRFRLARQGRDLDPAMYSEVGTESSHIRARAITNQLRRGATLSFHGIDELHEPLTRVSDSLETLFRGDTQINVYAAWRAVHGLDLHRDDQEVFILQVDGRKRWLLYGFSVDGVDRGELSTGVPPAGASFDQILEPGDLLYVPRGCYHIAMPMNEPALHLTVGVKNPRGRDLLLWMIDRVGTNDVVERDVPSFADAGDRLRYSEELRRVLLDGLGPDLVEQYFCEVGGNVKARPSFNLPWSAMPEPLPRGSDFLVRWCGRPAVFSKNQSNASSIELRSGTRTFRFPRSMRWVIDTLSTTTARPIGDIIGKVADRLDEETVRLLVTMLLREDLVVIIQAT